MVTLSGVRALGMMACVARRPGRRDCPAPVSAAPACRVAVGLAQKNMKVLIVDADPQSDVSAGFGYRDCDDSNETLTALMDAVMKDEDIPSECFIRHQLSERNRGTDGILQYFLLRYRL